VSIFSHSCARAKSLCKFTVRELGPQCTRHSMGTRKDERRGTYSFGCRGGGLPGTHLHHTVEVRYTSTCGVCPSLLQCGQRGHSGGPDRPRPCCWCGINHRSRSKAAHPGREPSDGTISSRLDRELQEVVHQDWTDARGVSFAIDPHRCGWHLEWQEHIARRTLILSTPTVCHPLHKCSLPQSTLSFCMAKKYCIHTQTGLKGGLAINIAQTGRSASRVG
jgi:hypothetical protein